MQTNQWFKLAILAFAGIILSSLSLSILTPDGQQSPQGPVSHTQGAPGQHGGGPVNNNLPSNYGQGGSPESLQMYQNQMMEMQYRLWEMQKRLNNMGAYGNMPMGSNGMPYGNMPMPNGMPYGNAYGNAYGNLPVNPNSMPNMPGIMPYGNPGYMGGSMYGPNPMNMYPGYMNPNMSNQGGMNMTSGNSNSNSNSGSGSGSGGGMSGMSMM